MEKNKSERKILFPAIILQSVAKKNMEKSAILTILCFSPLFFRKNVVKTIPTPASRFLTCSQHWKEKRGDFYKEFLNSYNILSLIVWNLHTLAVGTYLQLASARKYFYWKSYVLWDRSLLNKAKNAIKWLRYPKSRKCKLSTINPLFLLSYFIK